MGINPLSYSLTVALAAGVPLFFCNHFESYLLGMSPKLWEEVETFLFEICFLTKLRLPFTFQSWALQRFLRCSLLPLRTAGTRALTGALPFQPGA